MFNSILNRPTFIQAIIRLYSLHYTSYSTSSPVRTQARIYYFNLYTIRAILHGDSANQPSCRTSCLMPKTKPCYLVYVMHTVFNLRPSECIEQNAQNSQQ